MRTKTLKLFGLKEWDRKLMPCNLTFTQFLRKYVLTTVEVNPSRRQCDWWSHGERNPIEVGINYGILTETVITQPEKGRDDECSICFELLSEDPNEVFTPVVCKHSICYKCLKEGHQYLFRYLTYKCPREGHQHLCRDMIYNCPSCRRKSTVSKIVNSPDHDDFPDHDDLPDDEYYTDDESVGPPYSSGTGLLHDEW